MGKAILNGLTIEQEKFCQVYATTEEFFGNGVTSYANAYGIDIRDPKQYKTAVAGASRLLTNDNVLDRINDLLDMAGFNDVSVDKELLFVMKQKNDLGAKMAGIREYNKLKTRITEKREVTHVLPEPILGGIAKNAILLNDSDQEDSEVRSEN